MADHALNWRNVFNRLFPLINPETSHPNYFGGPRYVAKIQEFDANAPDYHTLMAQRQQGGESTSRKSYFYDLLMGLDETARTRFVSSVLDEVQTADPVAAAQVRALISGVSLGPAATIPAEMWNAERLNDFIETINAAIVAGDHERAVTLAYTCLEGFYKAFYRAKTAAEPPNDIIDLAKWVFDWIKGAAPAHPPELLALIKSTAHAVDKARNKHSESHFDSEATRWLSSYARDIVNTQIRLALHFM